MKRGQSALEYLVTYGWAILAIVIIAAVLWYFGVFNPAQWTESKGSGGFTGVTVIDYTVDGSTVTMVLGNKVGHAIEVDSCTEGINRTLSTTNTTFTCTIAGTTVGNQVNLVIPYKNTLSGMYHLDSGFVRTA